MNTTENRKIIQNKKCGKDKNKKIYSKKKLKNEYESKKTMLESRKHYRKR